ncbi:UDP-N-acetyl-D-glucosamine 6-dehydrogenase [Jeotgalicoccus aerolatus]|uniref:UDP-N-acetyl-D-galactosamine dehydrogenase n=1 Tax=Jeotgalicoccus aerolatus TaxID=709510 RepID=A0ABS4HM50_9STAP|nr:nucleotide sugar dehydrogenase [Jeotgalicoccus aerolatus]MBP1951898.1 UDP-N-acetyl-D-galactosamine dehydrogenase [Jeotgalicoccus aerolatus]GGD93873.1 UDP-N-acetyl-D-galactosamine dehydrogenase [Jeotgalicoccus aerolatus]CAD2074894.1 UDP-N-acetyl-D-glucosamine 6-dehydrogenase [Jeotgalicoccus aerolatus]
MYKLSEKLLNKDATLSVIGLGYVGLPIAFEFSKIMNVVGFDINSDKIKILRKGIDPTKEIGNEAVKSSEINFTSDEKLLKNVDFHIVSVPTPIKVDKTPDLLPIQKATKTIGENLKKGAYVVFESTVYPGVTEDICIPILEEESGLVCGVDFKVGYSPERINPGDKVNTLKNIIKIVSGVDKESLETISEVYELVITAGTHKVNSIKVAEAAKVVENSQRDINIAFMNELAVVFDKMNIDTSQVLEAMNTKWNALPFYPGLVGGHCIGVDPYYFIYEAEKLGYHSQIILSGRKINDSMGEYIGNTIVKKLIESNKLVKNAKVVLLGVTFKENCPDTRNSKVFDIVKKLEEFGIEVTYVDEQADKKETKELYGIDLESIDSIKDADCLVFAVAHNEFKDLSLNKINRMFKQNINDNEKIVIDVKNIFSSQQLSNYGFNFWKL